MVSKRYHEREAWQAQLSATGSHHPAESEQEPLELKVQMAKMMAQLDQLPARYALCVQPQEELGETVATPCV